MPNKITHHFIITSLRGSCRGNLININRLPRWARTQSRKDDSNWGKYFTIAALLFSLFVNNTIAQNNPLSTTANTKKARAVLKGIITDANTGKPLAGASIFIHAVNAGAISTVDGTYKTSELSSGNYLVEVSYIGYATIIETINITDSTVRNFALKEAVVEQEAVTVTGVATATRVKLLPQSVVVVNKKELTQSSATNIIEALGKVVPGFSSLTTGPAISKPVIRGLGYNRLITINDGVRQEGQQWGDEHGIEIDEYSIQRAEVLKGAASLIYGSDAMAGVLNFISNTPVEQNTIRANILGSYIDNNRMYGTHADIAGNLKNGFNWNVYGSYKSAASYQNKNDGYVLNSGFNENNFGGYIGVNKHWGYSHLLISNFNQKLGIIEGTRDAATGRFIAFPETSFEHIATDEELKSWNLFTPYQHVQHFKISTDNHFKVGNARITANIGFQRNQRREFGDPLATTTPNLYFDLSTVNYNFQYHFNEANGWKTSVGTNGMFQQNKNKALEVLIPEYNQFDMGWFAVTKKSLTDKLFVSGGLRGDIRNVTTNSLVENNVLRFDGFKKSFFNMSGSIGASYTANDKVIFKLNVARAFRAPNVSELSSNGAHEGTNRYEYGDVNLKPETSLQIDGGVEINSTHVSLSLNTFLNNITNYIFYRKLLNANGNDSLVNVGGNNITAFKFSQSNAVLAGFEVHLDIHPHPLDWLHFENTLSAVAGRFEHAIEGNNMLPFIPAPRWQSELKADIKRIKNIFKNGYAKIELDYTARQNNVFTTYHTETPTGSYTLLNLAFGTDIMSKGKLICNLNFAVNNITDVAYQNHLSRLKYSDYNTANNQYGVFNMGTNVMVKLNIPLRFSLSK